MVFNHTHTSPAEKNLGEQGKGTVVLYRPVRRQLQQHEWLTHTELARQIALLKGYAFGGEFNPSHHYDRPLYFVPSDTLLLPESADLGISDKRQLFGGVVPFPFIATKTITHPLPHQQARAPQGWSTDFADQVRAHVLPGFSAFSPEDVRDAASQLFRYGKIRLKLPEGIGGLGQSVIATSDELDAFLEAMDAEMLRRDGVVVEANLSEVRTYSVGQVLLDDLLVTYCGTQKLTRNNEGKEVYGGSDLTVVRGDFDRLLQQELDEPLRTAISQAQVYHQAAFACYSGMFVSRANYDVAQGIDDSGQAHSGVLEQSWRIGGASGAELAALSAFQADSAVAVVRASTTEVYGNDAPLPADAVIYCQETDEKIGPITKYSLTENYANAR